MSTLSSSHDTDALLGGMLSDLTVRSSSVASSDGGSGGGRTEIRTSEPQQNWNWMSTGDVREVSWPSALGNDGFPSPSGPDSNDSRASGHHSCVPNLIELTSSTEELSVCSTTSDYKSCDENDQSHKGTEQLDAGLISKIQITLDPAQTTEDYLILPSREPSHKDYLPFGVSQAHSNPSSRNFLSPRSVPSNEDDDYSPEEEPFMSRSFPQCPSAAQLSVTSSNSDPTLPTCRICHLPAGDDDNLISPCRCSGTMQYIHNGCLMVS